MPRLGNERVTIRDLAVDSYRVDTRFAKLLCSGVTRALYQRSCTTSDRALLTFLKQTVLGTRYCSIISSKQNVLLYTQ